MINLSVGVQHHPDRAGLLAPLLRALSGVETNVAEDPDPDGGAWSGYRYALESTPEWASHRIVIQDDGLPCPHFAQVVEHAINARPDRLLCLCVCGNAVATVPRIYAAGRDGIPWATVVTAQWCPVVAVVWPVRLIEPALAFVDAQHWPVSFNADDEIVGRIARHLKEPVLATVPSLVEHDDMQPSVTGKRTMYGNDPGRVTACPPAPGCDLLSIDWTPGPQ